MPHIGFHRAKQAGIGARPPLTKHRAKGTEFNRIPLASPCAVGFDELRCRRRQPSRGIGGLHTSDLSFFVGCSQALTAPIGIHSRAPNHSFNWISITQRRRQRLEQHSSRPFRTHITISRRIKTAATPFGRQQTGFAETHLNAWVNQSLNATRKGQLRLTAPQALASQVQSHQRRGTSRIHGEAGPFEIKGVGNSVGSNATGVAGEDEGFVIRCEVLIFRSPEQCAVISAGNAHEHPH